MNIRFSNQSSLVVTAVSLLIGGSVLSQGFAAQPSRDSSKPKMTFKKSSVATPSQSNTPNASFSPAQPPQQPVTASPVSSFNLGGQDSKALKQEVAALRSELEHARSRLQSHDAEKEDFSRKIQELSQQKDQLSTLLQEATDRHTKVSRELTEAQGKIKHNENLIADLNRRFETLEERKSHIEVQLGEAEGRNGSLEQENASMSREIQTQREVMEKQSQTIQRLQDSNRNVSAALEEKARGFVKGLFDAGDTIVDSIVTGRSVEDLFIEKYNRQQGARDSRPVVRREERNNASLNQSQRQDDEDHMFEDSLSRVQKDSHVLNSREGREPLRPQGYPSRFEHPQLPQSHLSFGSVGREEELLKAHIRHDMISQALLNKDQNGQLIKNLMDAMGLDPDRDFGIPRGEQTPFAPQSTRHVVDSDMEALD